MRSASFNCALLLAALGQSALAVVTIDTVTIGNPGNAPANPAAGVFRGGVAVPFGMGKYEVTNAQYVEFLNAADPTGANTRGLYNANMTTNGNGGIDFTAGNPDGSKYSVKAGRDNNPVVYVNVLDAMRMANWLQNGQGNANTEDGAYDMSLGNPFRKGGATVFVPNVDEWYKAAFHQPLLQGGDTDDYWGFATASNTAPTNPAPPSATPNTANYKAGNIFAVTQTGPTAVAGQNYLSDVGAYSMSAGFYGTFDQAGNVSEWLDDIIGTGRYSIGGSWAGTTVAAPINLVAAAQATEANTIGFRLAIPEPASGALLLACAAAFARRRRISP